MPMTMWWSICCINYREVLLWLAVLIGALVAAGIGAGITKRLLARNTNRVTSISLALLVAAPLAVVVAFAALDILYGVVRRGIVCIHFVRPAFLLPPLFAAIAVLRTATATGAVRPEAG